MSYPPTKQLTYEEQDLVWKFRYYLTNQEKVSEMILEDLLVQEVLHLAVILRCLLVNKIECFSILEASEDHFNFFYNLTVFKISNCNFPA